ncbi:MAG TPA: polymer-forming cytoskeletal protein [Thermoanaerobaculia bacterium]|jgi:cytoskeletal protein CcmA (bactofilin family)|nr:polymer-forming cytoskeletal protein [Thermoanaerobaculia bacterium]
MKTRGDGATLNGFLDKGSHLRGELTFEETFRIDGRFEGKIPSGSELILGDSAEVDAEIRVERLSINGALKGSVHASERIEIHPRARVTAQLHTPVLRIEEGAFFQGSCSMNQESAPKLVEVAAPSLRK